MYIIKKLQLLKKLHFIFLHIEQGYMYVTCARIFLLPRSIIPGDDWEGSLKTLYMYIGNIQNPQGLTQIRKN